MKVKKVNRYYCEYCKKSGCSARWMKRHENRCTKNPNRVCGYCKLLDQEQPQMADLVAILPNPDNYSKIDETGFQCFEGLEEAVKTALPKLREIVDRCPACVMSALRQRGIPVPIATDFNFSAECKSIWDDFNESQIEDDYYD